MKTKIILFLIVLTVSISAFIKENAKSTNLNKPKETLGFIDASSFGF